MKKTHGRLALLLSFALALSCLSSLSSAALVKGIYISQETAENTKEFTYLIENAKKSGINTFVVDLELPSKRVQNNVALLKANNINYVARIIMFPNGGTPEQILSEAYWEKKYRLINYAISYGATQIQLDYIRYSSKQPPSPKHAQDIYKIIQFYKERLAKQNIPLQIDVFGISSFGESPRIGQNVKLFSNSIDALCPMVYPSHYEPFREHAVTPYKTVHDSLIAIKSQFKEEKAMPFKLYPYIELSNYRYPLSQEKKWDYIYAQIQAVETAGADGWYAWSPNNYYDNLFHVLQSKPIK
jgi:hypothetical protein